MSDQSGVGQDVRIECSASESFAAWIARAGGSLAISTYQAGKVAMVGYGGGQLHLLMRQFDKPLGIAVAGDRLALATRNDLWLFANARLLAHDYLEQQPGRYDALYLPRVTYHTGNLHVHDVAYGNDGLWIVNTRFSCLARLSEDFHFVPAWRPRFVSDLVPEDRCHLNGLAMVDGQPRFATALGECDTAGGWRDDKAAGGIVIDLETDEIVCRGLSMPHSPRYYDNRLWVLNSGTGELCTVDTTTGQAEAVCALPGYLRGLAFVGPFALIGMSHIREKHIFGGLPLQEREAKLQCGVAVIDLRTGQHGATFEFTSGCTELYDVQFLPGVHRPTILNMDKDAIHAAVTNPQSSFWMRESAEIAEQSAEITEQQDAGQEARSDSDGTVPDAGPPEGSRPTANTA